MASAASKASTVRAVGAANDVTISSSVSLHREAAYELGRQDDEEDGIRYVPEPTGESESEGEVEEEEEEEEDEEGKQDSSKKSTGWNWFKPAVNRHRSMHFQFV
ncbi:hypothetical protein EON65_40960 [archaeon]|nr:MAG: hypothetical protein EON65_40960 [archaeon]